jgi:hypothetical protein
MISSSPAIPAHRYVVSVGGKTILGEITAEQAKALGCKSGPIKLLNGFQTDKNEGFGLVHIEAHGQRMIEIKGLGFDAATIVCHAAESFTVADNDKSKSGRIVCVCPHRTTYLHLVLQWDDEQFWSVTTVMLKRHRRDVKDTWTKERPDESEPTSESAGN